MKVIMSHSVRRCRLATCITNASIPFVTARYIMQKSDYKTPLVDLGNR